MKIEHNIQEVTVHYRQPKLRDMAKINSSQDVEMVMRRIADPERMDHKEFFWVVLMNRSNHVLAVSRISEGCTSGTMVNIREIFQLAIKTNAVAIALCHNHPSGNLQPSQADIALTKRIKEGAKLLDICVLDHVILTSDGYFSFTDSGVL